MPAFWRSGKRSPQRRYNRRTPISTAIELLEDRLVLSATWGVEPAPIDGVGNNIDNPEWGSVDTQLLRRTSVEYGDQASTPAGQNRPSPREVSNAVVAQSETATNDRFLTDIVWLWGQFLDHDIDLTEGAEPAEPWAIEVPQGDPYFDPGNTGTQTIGFNRSVYDPSTGDSASNPRQQINQITAFIDGSVVYGSDEVRADELRLHTGGRLKTSLGDLLPFNDAGLPNAGGTGGELFLAGDVRANENAALTAMHTLFVREHNRIAGELELENPSLTDEEIYQHARAIVTAEIQAITYNEFLPALLGSAAITPYAGYDSSVNPGISNIFSTASYRLGHSLLSSELHRLNNDGTVASEGNLALQDAFFAPDEIQDHGIDSLLLGLASHQAQELDTQIVDDVRNFLFGPPGSGGFDLASLNIQRGRDHGLPDYNQARMDLGLEPVTSFAEITSNPLLEQALRDVYGDLDEIDVWVGGLAEDHLPGSSVGELLNAVIVDQFERLRDGDRYWYQNVFTGDTLQEIENTTLADVIRRNTSITNIQDNVFYDDSVFVYRTTAGAGPVELTLKVKNSHIQLVDSQTKALVHSKDLQSTSAVVIFGTGAGDRITLATSVRHLDVPIEIHGIGGDDALEVRGTSRSDHVVVDASTLSVNGATVFYGNFEELVVWGGKRDDYLEVCGDSPAHITLDGGKGNDVLIGGWGYDVLDGGKGQDILFGNWGDDVLFGGKGLDILFGGRGSDYLNGGRSSDLLVGGYGADGIFGGGGGDSLLGGPGDDWLDGGTGDNVIFEGLGDDSVVGNRRDLSPESYAYLEQLEPELVDLAFSDGLQEYLFDLAERIRGLG